MSLAVYFALLLLDLQVHLQEQIAHYRSENKTKLRIHFSQSQTQQSKSK